MVPNMSRLSQTRVSATRYVLSYPQYTELDPIPPNPPAYPPDQAPHQGPHGALHEALADAGVEDAELRAFLAFFQNMDNQEREAYLQGLLQEVAMAGVAAGATPISARHRIAKIMAKWGR